MIGGKSVCGPEFDESYRRARAHWEAYKARAYPDGVPTDIPGNPGSEPVSDERTEEDGTTPSQSNDEWLYVVYEEDWSSFAIFADRDEARRCSGNWFGSRLARVPEGTEVRNWVLDYPEAAGVPGP